MAKLKRALHILALYLAIAGTITFSLFIIQEAFQTAMFSTWAAQDANNWAVCKAGADLMGRINFTLKIVNYSMGWIQPLAFIAYGAYAKAADQYVQSLTAKILAHAPELYLNQEIDLSFVPNNYSRNANGSVTARTGKIQVTLAALPADPAWRLSGVLRRMENSIQLELTDIETR